MSLSLKGHPEFPDYQKVLEFEDLDVGLHGFIAIHNTNLGPALGGTRIVDYFSSQEALADALRLSKAMTYKCALAGMPFGGGKGVIMAKPETVTPALLRQYAEAVNSFQGLFHTGEDVGLSEANVQYMCQFSNNFIGQSHLAGDPSPWAGLSAFLCIQEIFNFLTGSSDISGKTFAVKGLGKTGSALVDWIIKNGGQVIAADVDETRVKELKQRYPQISIGDPKTIITQQADVFCPCALSHDLDAHTAQLIKAKIIVGTANNQLVSDEVAQQLFDRGIWHAPDYVANGGGLIDVANELMPGGFNKMKVTTMVEKVPQTLHKILELAQQQKICPDIIADRLAEKIFNSVSSRSMARSDTYPLHTPRT